MTDLCWMSANDLVKAYDKKALSPVEVARDLLRRIDLLNPKLNVFVDLRPDEVMKAAHRIECEMMSGDSHGSLRGIPYGVKDIIDVANVRTTCHSRVLLDNVAASNAYCVDLLNAAGAFPIGKLATWEFAVGGPSFDLPFPPAVNPWRAGYSPGGSSSGSGAGLAAGMFPLALGTDTGGSIRHPAAACGIVGLKPTYGLVSRRGVFPFSFTMDHVGPMGRTVKDVALMLNVIAGRDTADPGSASVPRPDYAALLGEGCEGVRIGYVRRFHESDTVADVEVGSALDSAARTFQKLGARLSDINLPHLKEFEAVQKIIQRGEAWTVHAPWLRSQPEKYGAHARRRIAGGAFFTAENYISSQRRRSELMADVVSVFETSDILLTANAMDPAPRLDDPDRVRQARMPFNVTGHPAISLMAGLSKSGLPLSLQLVSRHFNEQLLLKVAAAFERETGFHELRPSCLDSGAWDAHAEQGHERTTDA